MNIAVVYYRNLQYSHYLHIITQNVENVLMVS